MTEPTILSSIIRKQDEGLTLIDFLSRRFRYQTRETWQRLILEGEVTLNGGSASIDSILKKKDAVAYTVVLDEPPVDKRIRVLHEEESFLAAFKPGNLPSHADGNYIKHTFIHLLKERMQAGGYHGYLNLVHRLDRETSGIMIVAKTKDAARSLAMQFEAGDVEKEYMAVTRGVIPENAIDLDGPIAPDPGSIISIRKCVVPTGSPNAQTAFTRFEVLERLCGHTLVRCIPKTGRTNQIRVHLAHLGHSLAGDKLYGRSDQQFLEYVQGVRAKRFDPLPWMDAPRQMLHASTIAFRHPETGTRISYAASLPEDMQTFIQKL